MQESELAPAATTVNAMKTTSAVKTAAAAMKTRNAPAKTAVIANRQSFIWETR